MGLLIGAAGRRHSDQQGNAEAEQDRGHNRFQHDNLLTSEQARRRAGSLPRRPMLLLRCPDRSSRDGFAPMTMPAYFGIRIVSADKDTLVGELDVDDRHVNNGGHVHGGAIAAFADDLGGSLAALNVAKGFGTTTIESKTNILRACGPGRLTGVSVPVHVGRRTIVLQTSIYRTDGKLAAMMIQTQLVVPREPKPAAEA